MPGPGYPPPPPPKRGGTSPALLLVLGLIVVAVLGVGGAYALKVGPFGGSPNPSTAVLPSLPTLPSFSIPPLPTFVLPSGLPTIPTQPGQPTPPVPTLPPLPSIPGFSLPPLPSIPGFSLPPLPSIPGFTLPPLPSVPTGTMTPEQQALLAHVPESLRGLCSGTEYPTAAAAIVCTQIDTATAIEYIQFTDAAAMNTQYQGFVFSLSATEGSGQCADPQNGAAAVVWPQENSYTIADAPAGRLVCGKLSSLAEIAWTDDRLTIMSFAIRPDGDQNGIYQLWLDAGPQ